MSLRELIPWKRKELAADREENSFDSLQRDLSRILDRFSHGFGRDELARREEWWGGSFPAVDVAETDKEILVTAELPGIDEKDLDLSIRGSQLLIRGEKKAEKEEKGEHYYHKESTYGSFSRSIPLPTEIDDGHIEATYQKGVLKIKLPKSAVAQKASKKISVH